MSERYTKLYSLPENLYSEGSPVTVAAGNLLKDNNTGNVLAQLKLQNISPKSIKAATVRITPFDTAGNPLGEAIDHQYLDLNAERDESFGQKEPVTLPDASTRALSVCVTEVIFADNTVLKQEPCEWEPLKAQTKLAETIEDAELLKQYRIKYGDDCEYVASDDKDLWLCACGAINRRDEETCHKCGKSEQVLNNVDMSALEAERDARLDAERLEAERIAAEKSQKAAEQKKKLMKRLKIIVPVVAVVIVALILIVSNVNKGRLYEEALAHYNAKEYAQAYADFDKLGNYKDSKQYTSELEEPWGKLAPYVGSFSYNGGTMRLSSDFIKLSNGKVYWVPYMENGDWPALTYGYAYYEGFDMNGNYLEHAAVTSETRLGETSKGVLMYEVTINSDGTLTAKRKVKINSGETHDAVVTFKNGTIDVSLTAYWYGSQRDVVEALFK